MDYALMSKAFWYGIFHIQFGDPVKRVLVSFERGITVRLWAIKGR